MSSMQIDQVPVFGRDSHVLDYWLANAEGFRVKRRGRWPSRVERVVHEPDGMRASALVLSSALTRRRRLVDAYAVVSVDPAARRLVLAGSPAARLRRARALLAATARRSAPRLAAAARTGAAAARTTGVHGAAGARWLLPRAVALARASAAQTAAAIAWLQPRTRALGRKTLVQAARLAPIMTGALRDAAVAARSARRPGSQ